ncbi:hypothetical protein IG631_05135 [Alternaria alternata]|nr:hypothetical protein IG631_05135 [Alternaria alternata]
MALMTSGLLDRRDIFLDCQKSRPAKLQPFSLNGYPCGDHNRGTASSVSPRLA